MRSDTFTEPDGSRYDTHVERIHYSEDSEGGSVPAVRDEILWKRHLRRDLARVPFFRGRLLPRADGGTIEGVMCDTELPRSGAGGRKTMGRFLIGAHVSSAKGYEAMGREALSLGANTLAFFTRNPRGGRAKELDADDVAAFRALAEAHEFGPIVAHAPYTLNACAAKEHLRTFAREVLKDDLARLAQTPGNLYNFHPGSHVGQGAERGIKLIAAALDEVLEEYQQTTVLLETMAGKGTEVGRTFEELAAIIARVGLGDRLGVCLDTCHVWDAGYDIAGDLDGVLKEFDAVIGIDRLRAIHLNDSLNERGAHKDRHARIGEGCIGLDALVRVIRHPALQGLPFILETPNDHAGYAREIALLRAAWEEARG